MSKSVKSLVFRGVAKKQQVLLKSYLNLASHELGFDIHVVKEGDESYLKPDLMIIEESHELDQTLQYLFALPHIVIGDNIDNTNTNYLCLPIQWSDFKTALQSLDYNTDQQDIVEEGQLEQEKPILPDDLELIVEEQSETIDHDGPLNELDVEEHNFELGQFSEDYQSFSSSEYAKVVDDVKQFHGSGDDHEPVLLVSDDESSFSSSVLVLEAEPGVSWDFSDANSDFDFSAQKSLTNTLSTSELLLTEKQGVPVSPTDELWKSDLEILSDNKSLLFVKSKRSMVYSDVTPGLWLGILATGKLSKIVLQSSWTPFSKLSSYPLSLFVWACNYALNNDSLVNDLSETDHYLLETWPSFDLLYYDNRLLKLATLLFVNPESKQTLVEKSGLSEQLIVGFLNASFKQGILKKAYEIDLQKANAVNASNSVLGKLKEVFK